ncbi:MAG: archaellum operon transcriptional activator EarA family protein [Candidatus Hodarchaeota archaeon]
MMEDIPVELLELLERSKVRWEVLKFLAEQSLPSYVNQIAKKVKTASRNVSAALKVFEELELVEFVKKEEKDKPLRMKFWRITPKGRWIVEILKESKRKEGKIDKEESEVLLEHELKIAPGKPIDLFGKRKEKEETKKKSIPRKIDFSKVFIRYNLKKEEETVKKEEEPSKQKKEGINFDKVFIRYNLKRKLNKT